jgi:hypothetical protein
MGAIDASGSGPDGSPQWDRGSSQAIVTCEVTPTRWVGSRLLNIAGFAEGTRPYVIGTARPVLRYLASPASFAVGLSG